MTTKTVQKNSIMKAIVKIFSLALMLVSSSLTAGNWQQKEEEYIDDIPFNTRLIFDSVQASRFAADFRPAEEAYIDDIPFDTHKIACRSLSDEALRKSYPMPEEPYINDIPFNTQSIASKYRAKQCVRTIYVVKNNEFVR